MSKNIEISESTFQSLESLAKGFDTPDSVISRLINNFENKKETKPLLSFIPSDEKRFLKLLVRDRLAEVVLYKNDGSRTITEWNASKLMETSNLRANLWSGFLRGWKEKGIISAEFSIYPNLKNIENEKTKILASTLNLTFSEMKDLDDDYEITKHVDTDGRIYDFTIRFLDGCNSKILANINGLNKNKELKFGAFTDISSVISNFSSKSILEP
ncbi:hypothetical protein V6255_17560 [Psychromonas arctica]|uniref:Uncharacterized protein n=1 Tax=Psychromonas arctica TaxID=168275 RepID=A0ABU9HGR3_9GAMM